MGGRHKQLEWKGIIDVLNQKAFFSFFVCIIKILSMKMYSISKGLIAINHLPKVQAHMQNKGTS